MLTCDKQIAGNGQSKMIHGDLAMSGGGRKGDLFFYKSMWLSLF
jgi:hypothetical protein